MVRVEFLPYFGFRIGLEVLVHTLVVFVGTTAVGWLSIVTGRKIFILESGRENRSRLNIASLAQIPYQPKLVSTHVVGHFILRLDALGTEEILQRLLLLPVKY